MWPGVEIVLRADSGVCREELMNWCEQQGVFYVFGFVRNERLRRLIEQPMQEAAQQPRASGQEGVKRIV